jgi:hypothetical protein
MSSGSHYGASEESILAMLERDAGRERQGNTRRLALYATAGLLVCALMGTLALLLTENNSATGKIRADAQRGVSVTLVEEKPRTAMRDAQTRPAESIFGTDGAATIVDSREPAARWGKEASPPATITDLAPPLRETARGPSLAAGGTHASAQLARVDPMRSSPQASASVRPPSTRTSASATNNKATSTETFERDTDVELISAIITLSGKHKQTHGEHCAADGDRKCVSNTTALP